MAPNPQVSAVSQSQSNDSAAQVLWAVNHAGRGLRVVFERRGDRFAHRVELCDGEGTKLLLISEEGDDSELWPPSPPLQQFSVEERADGDVALLVGMAGKSHWSASIAVEKTARRIVYDVACRVRETPVRLGTSFLLVDKMACACSLDQRRVEFGATAGEHEAAVARFVADDAGPACCEIREDQRRIVITPTLERGPQATWRWRFCLESMVAE